MKIFADVADKRYFAKLARKLMMLPGETRISENGIYGVSDIKSKAVIARIDSYLREAGPVIYEMKRQGSVKVAGYLTYHVEYVDLDDDSLISVSVCDSEAGTLICVAEVEY